MTVIAITASRTSPGATTLAAGLSLALTSKYERSLLIEADPAGGVLSLRFGLDVTPSLTTFGSDTRNGYANELVWKNTQDMRGVLCMPAPVDPRLARSWVERVTPMLKTHLRNLGAPAIVDLGWIAESGPSLGLAEAADVTLVVTRPHVAEVQALLFQVRQLQATGATVGLVTVGTTPNDPQEVASVAGIPLVAVLPDDPKCAAALRGAKFAPNKFRRSLLWRTISAMATSLVDEHQVTSRAIDTPIPVSEVEQKKTRVALVDEPPFGESQPIQHDPPAQGTAPTQPLPRPIQGRPETPTELVAPPAPIAPAAIAPAPQAPQPVQPAAELQPIQVSATAPIEVDALASVAPPPAYADLTPEALADQAPLPPVPAAPPVYAAPVAVPDQVPAGRPGFSERHGEALDPFGQSVHPDEIVVQTSGTVDVDLTIDPENFESTNDPNRIPDALIVLDSGERRRLNPDGAMLIGRHGDCEIVVTDSQVSRRHGRFTQTIQGWHYADLGSRNGSTLNGRPCTDAFLSPGDELFVGNARLIFQTLPTSERKSA